MLILFILPTAAMQWINSMVCRGTPWYGGTQDWSSLNTTPHKLHNLLHILSLLETPKLFYNESCCLHYICSKVLIKYQRNSFMLSSVNTYWFLLHYIKITQFLSSKTICMSQLDGLQLNSYIARNIFLKM